VLCAGCSCRRHTFATRAASPGDTILRSRADEVLACGTKPPR
jgi:hypothetical protein